MEARNFTGICCAGRWITLALLWGLATPALADSSCLVP